MWTDPVLSSAIMETMESTRRSVVCITDVLGSIAVPLSRPPPPCARVAVGDAEPDEEALSVNTHVKTHKLMTARHRLVV